MELPTRDGLEEYAESLDLSPTEVVALLESALKGEAATEAAA